MTVRQCVQQARTLLPGAGGAAEAEILLCCVLGCDRVGLAVHRDRTVSPADAARYMQYVERRAAGEPVAYITGEKEFMSLPFAVRPGVLVPRPDTETLVETALAQLGGAPCRVLDLCTGSGCVAVSVAHYLPGAYVTAVDVAPVCVETARENAARTGVSDRVEVVCADIFGELSGLGRFDAVLSNPPYVRAEVIPTLEPTVRDFEPRTALDGGTDGLAFYRRIAELAPRLLQSGGLLALEIGYDQGTEVRTLLEKNGRFGPVTVERDLAENDRVVWARFREEDGNAQ